jgi:trehalose-phosphatase
MRVLKPGFDLNTFFDHVQRAERRALLLDYDGTLAPFRVERDQATPYPGIREILKVMLATGHTRLVLVSGRWTRDLIPLLGLERLPEIWGSHGWERLLPNGLEQSVELDQQATTGLSQAYQWAASLGLVERCERKPASLALHWRGLAPHDVDTIREHILERWSL